MKPPVSYSNLRGVLALRVAITLALAAAASVSRSAEPADRELKPYVVYMGTDFAIRLGDGYVPVIDVKGKNFVVKNKGQEKLVPMIGGKVDLKIEQSLKLASSSATFKNLKMERGYTLAADPYMRFNQSTGGGLAAASQLDLATHERVSAEHQLGHMQYATASDMARVVARVDKSHVEETKHNENFSFGTMDNTGEKALSLQQALAEELFDAMEVSFEISAPEYLEKPYVVVIVRYHEKGTTSRDNATWIFAKAVSSIASRPETMRFLQGGLPAGFEIEETQIRLYNRGKEIATNVAPKRVELSEEDAFEYLKVRHVASNRGASVSAAPAFVGLKAEPKTKLTPNQQAQTYFVKVSPEGIALAAFSDEACSVPVDPKVGEVLGNVRFYPALQHGKPVSGTSRVVLSQLTL
jgi:hypothetical protein